MLRGVMQRRPAFARHARAVMLIPQSREKHPSSLPKKANTETLLPRLRDQGDRAPTISLSYVTRH